MVIPLPSYIGKPSKWVHGDAAPPRRKEEEEEEEKEEEEKEDEEEIDPVLS